jgi:hypothetical protein
MGAILLESEKIPYYMMRTQFEDIKQTGKIETLRTKPVGKRNRMAG